MWRKRQNMFESQRASRSIESGCGIISALARKEMNLRLRKCWRAWADMWRRCVKKVVIRGLPGGAFRSPSRQGLEVLENRKSTRLNSSHVKISYAVFCLKKKNNKRNTKL